MRHFLIWLIAVAAVAFAHKQSDGVLHDVPCSSHPIRPDVITVLRTDSYCKQPILVPEGQAVQIFITNRESYCGQLDEEERALAQITGGTLVNFCNATTRSFTLPKGAYVIGVSGARIPIQISLTVHNTTFGCDDIVPPSLFGVPLTFNPTEHTCSLVLPGRTVLEVKSIRRNSNRSWKSVRNCVRVRMGKHMYGLHFRWEPVCELPAHTVYKYELGCGAVVMDASSLAIESVEFVLLPMDDLKAVIAPLMCNNDRVDGFLPHAQHRSRPKFVH